MALGRYQARTNDGNVRGTAGTQPLPAFFATGLTLLPVASELRSGAIFMNHFYITWGNPRYPLREV